MWRKLKALGVAQISDGLVALPRDARTQEQLEWIAEEVVDAGGSATLWLAHPAAAAQERELAGTMAAGRAAEYLKVLAQAEGAQSLPEAERLRVMRRLRAELRRVHRRDYFPPAGRTAAETAVDALHPRHHQEATA